MSNNRIEILKNILLELHHGADPATVQDAFTKEFTGVSAMEISLMEHELMSSDTGITFEDVMKLCNVHANLFKGSVNEVDTPDAEQIGHPVRVFKEENLALRAALLRVERLLQTLEQQEEPEKALLQGLHRQLGLVGQFKKHYDRKEQVFFPLMEKHGHDAPPKVMWGVDDEIRELFDHVNTLAAQLPSLAISDVKSAFEKFSHEFTEMIFKEESILLMILLEIFSQDEWLSVANESEAYGYAIIPTPEKWVPIRASFTETIQSENCDTAIQLEAGVQVIDTPDGQITISYKPKEAKHFDRTEPIPFGQGYLSVEEANLILNHLPLEITFVNKDDLFQYYNDAVPFDEMIFKRTPSQVGRKVDLCHPPKALPMVRKVIDGLRAGKRDSYQMWFHDKAGRYVFVTYKGVHDANGEFQGVLEYVQNIQPFFELGEMDFRGILD